MKTNTAEKSVSFKKGDTKDFLDYTIKYCVNGDGIVLYKNQKRPKELYECHLGNYSTLDDAQKSAVIYFMLARPEKFATVLFRKVMNGAKSGCMSEFATFEQQVAKEGYEMPEEITPIDGMNYLIGYKGEVIKFS